MKDKITQEEFDKLFEKDEKERFTNLIIPAFEDIPEMNLIGKDPKDYTRDEIIRLKVYRREMKERIEKQASNNKPSVEKSNSICDTFIERLSIKYRFSCEKLRNEFDSFVENKKGITNEELNELKNVFPDIPESLIELLKYSNGTKIYCFQSDVSDGKYPYYLVNSKVMVEEKDAAQKYYGDYISREFDDVEIDEKITDDVNNVKWLLFSNCMNNGGTSQLFIDFTPSKSGKVGQIVRYLHDPDSIVVIADSFDEFLDSIIKSNYTFLDDEIERSKEPKKHPVKSKNKLSYYGILLFGVLSIIIGIAGLVYKEYFSIIMILSGIIFVFASISELKRMNK